MKKIILAALLCCSFSVQAADTIMSSTVSSSSNTVTVDRTPSTASAPPVMINNQDTCLVAVSGAVQSTVIGFSGAITQRDENCERIKLSRQLFTMGMKVAAVSIMCQDSRVFRAMQESGTPCPVAGQIGSAAEQIWSTIEEARPDYKEYAKEKQIEERKKQLSARLTQERNDRLAKARAEKEAQMKAEEEAERREREAQK